MDSSAISTKDLVVGIAKSVIAKCDDIDLKAGNVLVLIGRNGSGKSTFLRTLCGFLKPLDGEILYMDQPASAIELEKQLSWLSQDEHLEFSWTVTEYVSLGRIAQNSGLFLGNEDCDAVARALKETDTEYLSDRFVHELSGGERQRVRLARALAQETPTILMDEPTSHLDLDHQIQFLHLVGKLAQQGKSIVISLHDIVQARLIGTQFLLFEGQSASSIPTAEGLNKELLEQTLGVQFEQFDSAAHGGHILPTYYRTTD